MVYYPVAEIRSKHLSVFRVMDDERYRPSYFISAVIEVFPQQVEVPRNVYFKCLAVGAAAFVFSTIKICLV